MSLPEDRPPLSEAHIRSLREGSGLTDEIINERGYRTIEKRLELKGYGFSDAQCKTTPGLLIPVHSTDGEIAFNVFRPDDPPVTRPPKDDPDAEPKVLKYLLPKGQRMRLDCPPKCVKDIGNPSVPLWITEGQKKADALASRGLCAVALLGVWNFKGRNDLGGVTILADFDRIDLKGRHVRIVFDSDVVSKKQVKQALERLTEFLNRKQAHVSIVYLPPNQEDGETKKQGVDDYLLTHSVEQLEDLIEGPRPAPQATPPQVRLLDSAPPAMTRPLQIIDGKAYAAIWPWVEVTITQQTDAKGNIQTISPPAVIREQRLMILASDGQVYGPGGDHELSDLGVVVNLPEMPPSDKLLSGAAISRYRAGHRVDAKDVFTRILATVKQFIDFEKSLSTQGEMNELVACYIIASWFLDAFTVAGFLWPNGDTGSGKSQLLSLLAELGHLGYLITAGGSFAAMRDMADYGAMICFDDAENVADPRKFDPDKRALLLAGHRRGSAIPLKEPRGDRTWATRYVSTFCPRAFSAINIPDRVLATRTIVVPLIKTTDRGLANSDPADYAGWPHDRRRLIDDLWLLALQHLPELAAFDAKAKAKATLMGRDLEPWRGILAVASWLEGKGQEKLGERLEKLSVSYQAERKEMDLTDLNPVVIRALTACLGIKSLDVLDVKTVTDVLMGDKPRFIETAEILSYVKAIIEGEGLEIDLETVTSKRIGWRMRLMRFKSDRAMTPKRERGWSVVPKDVLRWTISLGLLDTPHQNVQNGQNVRNVQDEVEPAPKRRGVEI